MRCTGMIASVYYVFVIICICIVMINLLMAIMLGNYDKARNISDKKKVLEAFRILMNERKEHEVYVFRNPF